MQIIQVDLAVVEVRPGYDEVIISCMTMTSTTMCA